MSRTGQREQSSDISPPSSCQERPDVEVEISPTIPWMAEEERKTDELTIVERGQLFSVWSEKRRRLREGWRSLTHVFCSLIPRACLQR